MADKACLREKAREPVARGIMQGYLVYEGDRVIGWCNAGEKTNYGPIPHYEKHGFQRTAERYWFCIMRKKL